MQYGIVDLGSNSFRLEIFQVVDGQIQSLAYHKETIRLVAGLDANCYLTPEIQHRALEALSRFSLYLQNINPFNIRAVGTQTFRIARNAQTFLQKAEKVLGTTIQILSGDEEARLAYLGATFQNTSTHTQNLVIDIGGGSTEFALGTNTNITATASLPIGCVNTTLRFASDGFFDTQRYEDARQKLDQEFRHVDIPLHHHNRILAFGAAGTFHALEDACIALQWSDGKITHQDIQKMLRYVIKLKDLQKIQFNFIRPDRRDVLIGGLLVVDAVFRFTNLPYIQPVRAGVRTGMLLDLLQKNNDKFYASYSIL